MELRYLESVQQNNLTHTTKLKKTKTDVNWRTHTILTTKRKKINTVNTKECLGENNSSDDVIFRTIMQKPCQPQDTRMLARFLHCVK